MLVMAALKRVDTTIIQRKRELIARKKRSERLEPLRFVVGKAKAWIGKDGNTKTRSSLPPMNSNPKSATNDTIIPPEPKKEKKLLSPLKKYKGRLTQPTQLARTKLADIRECGWIAHRREKASVGKRLH